MLLRLGKAVHRKQVDQGSDWQTLKKRREAEEQMMVPSSWFL